MGLKRTLPQELVERPEGWKGDLQEWYDVHMAYGSCPLW